MTEFEKEVEVTNRLVSKWSLEKSTSRELYELVEKGLIEYGLPHDEEDVIEIFKSAMNILFI